VGILGDSKSGIGYAQVWPATLIAGMNATDNPSSVYWFEASPRDTWAIGSATVNTIKSSIDSNIALHSQPNCNACLINLGVNDQTDVVEANWKADYQYIIDALLVKWPGTKIYLVKPWSRGRDAFYDTMAGWIDDLIAANPGTCFAGHDARVWLKGADDGATMTSDGIHYSIDAGQAECAAQWLTILGY